MDYYNRQMLMQGMGVSGGAATQYRTCYANTRSRAAAGPGTIAAKKGMYKIAPTQMKQMKYYSTKTKKCKATETTPTKTAVRKDLAAANKALRAVEKAKKAEVKAAKKTEAAAKKAVKATTKAKKTVKKTSK